MIKIVIALIVAIATAIAGFFGVSKYDQNHNGQPHPTQQVERRAVAGEATMSESYDPDVPMHLRDGGEGDTKSFEQAAYYPLYASDAVRWGRNMYALAEAASYGRDASDFARLGYCEYQLRPNGTFRYYGVIYAEEVVSEGDYELRNGTITLTHRRVIEARNPKQMLSYLSYGTYRLSTNSTTGRREFSIEIHNYLEDFYWDKTGYRDSSGQRFQASAQNQTSSSAPVMSSNEEREQCAKKLLLLRRAAAEFPGELRDIRALGPDGELTCTTTSKYYSFDAATKQIRCEYHKQ